MCEAVTDSCRWSPYSQMGCQLLKPAHVLHIQVAACEAAQGFGASTALLTGRGNRLCKAMACTSLACQALPCPEVALSMSAMHSINGCCLFKHLLCGPSALCTTICIFAIPHRCCCSGPTGHVVSVAGPCCGGCLIPNKAAAACTEVKGSGVWGYGFVP